MVKPKPKLERKRIIPPSIMAIFVIVLFALTWIAIASAQMSRIETTEQSKTNIVPAEPQKPAVEPEKASEVPAPIAPPVVDPNGCEAKGQWYRADNNECIPKSTAAEPGTPAVTTASAGSGDCSLVNGYNWPVDTAMRVCMQESGGNPNNANWADDHTSWAGCMGSFGLMQINCSNGQVYDGARNMAIAYSMWKGAGGTFWQDWPNTCKKVGC
jgi:hypothetical protein